MWPILVAAGVYMICRGIQDGIDTNSSKNQNKLPPSSANNLTKRLPYGEYEIFTEDDWRHDDHER